MTSESRGGVRRAAFLALLTACSASCTQRPERLPELPSNNTSRAVHMALQEGFREDTVIVRINGQEMRRKEGVSSDPRIGLAASFDLPLPEGPVKLEVELADRGLSNSVTVDFAGTAYVAISHVDGRIDFKVADSPFGYL